MNTNISLLVLPFQNLSLSSPDVFFVNKETLLADLIQVNIRDHYMPVPSFMYGTLRYLDRTEVKPGMLMPTLLVIQSFKPKTKEKGLINLRLKDNRFDSIPLESLRPNPDLPPMGDEKPATD